MNKKKVTSSGEGIDSLFSISIENSDKETQLAEIKNMVEEYKDKNEYYKRFLMICTDNFHPTIYAGINDHYKSFRLMVISLIDKYGQALSAQNDDLYHNCIEQIIIIQKELEDTDSFIFKYVNDFKIKADLDFRKESIRTRKILGENSSNSIFVENDIEVLKDIKNRINRPRKYSNSVKRGMLNALENSLIKYDDTIPEDLKLPCLLYEAGSLLKRHNDMVVDLRDKSADKIEITKAMLELQNISVRYRLGDFGPVQESYTPTEEEYKNNKKEERREMLNMKNGDSKNLQKRNEKRRNVVFAW